MRIRNVRLTSTTQPVQANLRELRLDKKKEKERGERKIREKGNINGEGKRREEERMRKERKKKTNYVFNFGYF